MPGPALIAGAGIMKLHSRHIIDLVPNGTMDPDVLNHLLTSPPEFLGLPPPEPPPISEAFGLGSLNAPTLLCPPPPDYPKLPPDEILPFEFEAVGEAAEYAEFLEALVSIISGG